MQQVAKDSPVTALAAMISTRENPQVVPGVFPGVVPARRRVDEDAQGRAPAQPDEGRQGAGRQGAAVPDARGPDEKAMLTSAFADAVGEVFAGAPDAYHVQLQAARAYYAASCRTRATTRASSTAALGASIEATLPVAKFNGSPVAVPWGMDEATFKNRVANAFPQALKARAAGRDVAATGRYTLQNLTGTKYLVRQGTEYLTGPKGRVVIEVPEVPSAYQSPAERARRTSRSERLRPLPG
jgi:hypothetical protein